MMFSKLKAVFQPTGRLSWLLICAGSVLSGSLALAQQRVPPVSHPPMPALQLPVNRAQGAEALRLLGERLPDVARAHGMNPADLQNQLMNDRTLWIDRNGRLFYIEQALPPGTAPASPAPQPAGPSSKTTGSSGSPRLAAAAYTPADAFSLQSRPGAQRTLYLDFDGHVATGTAWNNQYGATITSPAFDLDGNPGSFSDAERNMIIGIWKRVAEDYAPFDINVTTQEPSSDALLRSNSSDATYGSRVVITKDFTSPSCNCGGFAYVGVFSLTPNSYYQPAYVFHDRLGNNEKNIAEATSHEAGHNLGLSHDGTSTVGYYSGHGSGETGWAPIMGVGYSKNLVQWSKGEYPNANQKQDDIVVIQQNGAPLRPDDHGNTEALATTMSSTPVLLNSVVVSQSLSASGVIETASDVDVFGFSASNGTVEFTVSGTAASPSPNLDVQLRLVNASNGNTVATSSPADTLAATLTATNLPAGNYYLVVEGVGKGDLTTGYSDYGSLGQYQITGTAPPPLVGLTPVPTLSASGATSGYAGELNVTFNGSATDSDGTIASMNLSSGDGRSASNLSSSSISQSFTYSTAGSYTATLRATDNTGLTGLASLQITVFGPRADVFGTTLSIAPVRNRQTTATAVVALRAAGGVTPAPGMTVTGRWSGVATGSASAITDANGNATFRSPAIKKTGTVTFEVTGVTGSAYTYDASLSTAPTSASATISLLR